jgi:hypothetical protein
MSSQSVHLSISPDQVVVPAATVHHEHPDTSEVCLTNTHGGGWKVDFAIVLKNDASAIYPLIDRIKCVLDAFFTKYPTSKQSTKQVVIPVCSQQFSHSPSLKMMPLCGEIPSDSYRFISIERREWYSTDV